MKAISIRNPYAHFILCGEKKYEFRTWKTDYRGDLLICSSAYPKIKNTASGYALCVVRLNDIIEVTTKNYRDFGLKKVDLPIDGKKLYAWQLTENRSIKPFKVKGKLNFFNVDDESIEIFDENNKTDEEIEKFVEKYLFPIFYKFERCD